MAEAASSPKRKRTDDAPSAISPEQILKSNATVEHFMGQRHNRWMQGYQSATASGGGHGGTSAAARSGPQQTEKGPGAWRTSSLSANGRPHPQHEGGAVMGMESNGVSAHVQAQRAAEKEGATGSTNAAWTAGANVVDYDSPFNPVFPNSTNNANTHPTCTTTPGRNAPRRPSPAPSEDYTNSPTISPSLSLPDMDPPSRGRGRPPGSNTPANAAARHRNSSFHDQRQKQSTDNRRSMQTNVNNVYFPPPRPAHQQSPHVSQLTPPFRQQGPTNHHQMQPNQQQMPQSRGPLPPSRPSSAMSVTPSSPAQLNLSTPNQQRSSTSDRYAADALNDRIERFIEDRTEQEKTNVDDGRLFLLRDAVYPRVDWFYVALSQIHALTAGNRDKLPEVARSVPPESWNAFGQLVCPNSMVSGQLLKYLAEFPATIETMYTDIISSSYSTYVAAAAHFVRALPMKWDGLLRECWARRAPPLSQDLVMDLGLGSQVLQTVAFRAIVRMIWDANDVKLLEHLESLHRADQQVFTQLGHRPPEQKELVYHCFKNVQAGWERYLSQKQIHDANPQRAGDYPAFNTSNCFQKALAVFSGRRAPDPIPDAGNAQQARTLLQQQQAMMHNQQMLNQAMPPQLQQRMNAQPLAQLNMPARPPPAQPMFQPRGNLQSSGQQQQAMVYRQQMQRQSQPRVNAQASAHPNTLARPAFAGVNPAAMPMRANLARMPMQRHQPGPHLVFPHEMEGPRSHPTEPDANRSALQEAHLRSPVPVPLQIGGETPQLYRYVCSWALSPTALNAEKPVSYLTFDMPQEEFNRIPKIVPSQTDGELSNRVLSEQSHTYRLRCCKVPGKSFQTEHSWVTADTYYPQELYLEFNGHMLQMRHPIHHKKYLPVDLTKWMKLGENKIKVVINRTSTDNRPFIFALGVETVGVVAHSTLTRKVNTEQVVSATTTKALIQNKLSGTDGEGGDDEITVTSEFMQIKLFDPFSGSKIFDIPVRGASCTHIDCFDLETFLSQSKRDASKEGAPTIVDCWRCPICRGDARPNQLVKEEWLVQVRETLERMGKLDTRAIMVKADGSWKPKVEERTGVRSASLEREEMEMGRVAGRSGVGSSAAFKPKSKREVIELD